MKATTNAASKLRSICRDKLLQKPIAFTDCSRQQQELMSSCCNHLTALQQGLAAEHTTDHLIGTLLESYKASDSLASILGWLMEQTDELAAKLLLLSAANDVSCSVHQRCLDCLAKLLENISQLPDDRRKHFNSILTTSLQMKGVLSCWPELLHKLLQLQQQVSQQQHAEQPQPQATLFAPDNPLGTPAVQQIITCWAFLWKEWKRANPFPAVATLAVQARSMLQEVQRCIQLLPQRTAAATSSSMQQGQPAAVATSAAGASSSRSSKFRSALLTAKGVAVRLACIQAAVCAAMSRHLLAAMMPTPHQPCSMRLTLQPYVESEAAAEAAMQQLAAGCSLLRAQLTADLTAAMQADNPQKRRLAQKLLWVVQDVPKHHSSVLQQICPAAEAYIRAVHDMYARQEVSAYAVLHASSASGHSSQVSPAALSASCEALDSLWVTLQSHLAAVAHVQRRGEGDMDSCPALLTAGAVQMSIELQLLLCAYSTMQLPWLTQELLQQPQLARTFSRSKSVQATLPLMRAFMDWSGKVAAAVMIRGCCFLQQQLFLIMRNCSSGDSGSSMHSTLQAVLQQSGEYLLRASAMLLPVVEELWLFLSIDIWHQLAPIAALDVTHAMLGGSSSAGHLEASGQGAGNTPLRGHRLAALAAAHPEAYYGLIECCARSPLLDAREMLLLLDLLVPTVLSNTAAAAASLVSAVASASKRMVKLIKAVVTAQDQPADADNNGKLEATLAAKHFPAAVPWFCWLLRRLATLARACRTIGCRTSNTNAAGSSSNASSSSSSGAGSPQQSLATAALLTTVLSRSVVLVADAMEAAAAAEGSTAAQLFARCVMAKPAFVAGWELTASEEQARLAVVGLFGSKEQYNTTGQWMIWQLSLLSVLLELHGKATAGLEAKSEAAAAASSSDSSGSCTGGDSAAGASTAAGCCRWGYLLDLQRGRAWPAAAAAVQWSEVEAAVGWFDAVGAQGAGRICTATTAETQPGSQPAEPDAVHVSRLYNDAVEHCRALVAAAPLPLVCNNPDCEDLSGVSEASIAVKMCAGCHCRYCSAACQTADWKRHRKACKRMAAAGQVCA